MNAVYAHEIDYGLVPVTPPAAEPLSRAEAKLHLRVDLTDDDADIDDLVRAARELVEEHSGRSLVTQTWRLELDRFPCWDIRLPRGPLQSVTSITYIDVAGATQTLSSSLYRVVPSRNLVEPVYAGYWPATQYVSGAVLVTYAAGFGAAGAVPLRAKQAIKLLVGEWYANRELLGTVPLGVEGTFAALVRSLWDGRY